MHTSIAAQGRQNNNCADSALLSSRRRTSVGGKIFGAELIEDKNVND
jgi:hypothetical protein